MSETMLLRLRDRELVLRFGVPTLMGIVNCTPDSFSDRRRLRTVDEAVDRARALTADGAALIDVGGESGVTHTPVVDPGEEIDRVLPVVERLVGDGLVVSVDTWKPAVAEAVLGAGAHLINDVSALHDPRLADVVASWGAGLVVMHTRADPKTEAFPDYRDDVVGDVRALLAELCERAVAAGVRSDALVLDPGPDFTKLPGETVRVMQDLPALAAQGRPILLAISRKYFVGTIIDREPDERLAGTLAALGWAAARAPFAIARVHDVREAADYLRVHEVLDGRAAMPDAAPDEERLRWLHDPVG